MCHGCKNDNVQMRIIFFLIFAQNIDCGHTLEPLPYDGSNENPHSMFSAKIRKIMHISVNPSITI